MVGKQDKAPQLSIFDTPLKRFINLEHELCILSHQIDWDSIEEEFSVYYSETGRPSVPIRRMVGLLLLKHIYTLEEHFTQTEYLTESKPKTGIVDRGYKGKKKINGTEIISPSVPKNETTQYQKQKARKQFRARAGIEPVISHIKYDHRMLRNYLKGVIGDQLNTILAGTGYNLKKMLNRIKEQILFDLIQILSLGKLLFFKDKVPKNSRLFKV